MNDNILKKALELTQGDRQKDYGTPYENWTRTAKIASAMLGFEMTAQQCALVAFAMKFGRLMQTPGHVDTMVDLAGYAWVMSEIVKGENEARMADGWGHIHEDDSLKGVMRELRGMIGGDKHEQLMDGLRGLLEEERRKVLAESKFVPIDCSVVEEPTCDECAVCEEAVPCEVCEPEPPVRGVTRG